MGLEQSKPLEQWQASDVAAEVGNLGQQYTSYSAHLFENGVDGAFLASLSNEEVKETLDDLGIDSRLHRRVLEKKLNAVKAGKTGVSICVSTYSCSKSVEPSMYASESFQSSSGEFSCPPQSPFILHSPRTPRMGDNTDRTFDHCRRRLSASVGTTPRRQRRRRSKVQLEQDRSEMMSNMAARSMEDRSEKQALLRRQNSLQKQINNLKNIATASQ